MTIDPIGQVRRLDSGECEVLVLPAYEPGLEGIIRGTKLQILYWMHELEADDREVLKVHPRGDTSRAKRGVFALRSNQRPNPIGVSIVEVLRTEGSGIVVRGLDARDDSPLIDIKGDFGTRPLP